MTQNTKPIFQAHLNSLTNIIKQKNQLINHLTTKINNQQKQIQNLIQNAQSKHYHQISQYYYKNYQKYLKNEKYLLLRIDQIQENGIFLPKNVKIVHFGELQVSNWGRTESFDSGTTAAKGFINFGTVNTDKTSINDKKSEDLIQTNSNKKESSSLQKKSQSLSKQIETLKSNLNKYSKLIKNNKQKSAIKQTQQISNQLTPNTVQSIIKYQNTSDKNNMENSNKSQNSSQKNKSVEEFSSLSPIKKKNKTKTIFIRKK